MKKLTRAEEEVMQVLWKLKKGGLMDIVEAMPAPQPHKNTVATILKKLTEKGFVSIELVKRFHTYLPAITQDQYSNATLSSIAKGYFQNSYSNVVSFLVDKKKLSVSDLELLIKQLKKK